MPAVHLSAGRAVPAARRLLLRLRGRPLTPSEAWLRDKIVADGGSLRPRRPGTAWRPWVNRALQTREEVERAVETLRTAGLAPHPDRPKNWDALVALGTMLEATRRRDRILDMGAATYSPLLTWLYQFGYRRLLGIDLAYTGEIRRGPIRLRPMDLTATTFEDGWFGGVACLSVIEHGVDVEAFLREAARLLRPGGVLVASTDYWPEPIDTAGLEAFGHPVRVFDRAGIQAVIDTARRHGLELAGPVDLDATDKVVRWERFGLDYTFAVLVFRRVGRH